MRNLSSICVAILVACGAASAQDSTDLLKFHGSTAIMIAGTELPAGDNTIRVLDAKDGNIVLLVRSEFGPQAFVLTNRLYGAAPHGSGQVHVTLQRQGNTYRLDQIWLPDHTGFQVLQSGISGE
jgi:hypothetical protein